MVSLRVITGPRAGEQIDVSQELVIGRQGADVIFEDAELSRRHLGVRPEGDLLVIEDLGSTNGTFVDDQRIAAPMHLADGARVKLGSTVLEVAVVQSVQATRLSGAAHTDKTSVRSVATAAPVAPTPAPPAAAPPPPPAATRPPAVPAPVAVAAAVPAPAPAPVAAPAAPAPARGGTPAVQVGAFTVSHKRRGGLASRSWVPVALSFGTVIATAALLVFYFATRAHP